MNESIFFTLNSEQC